MSGPTAKYVVVLTIIYIYAYIYQYISYDGTNFPAKTDKFKLLLLSRIDPFSKGKKKTAYEICVEIYCLVKYQLVTITGTHLNMSGSV